MAEEELWQGYHRNGELAGPITKDQAKDGTLHGASHVWLWRRQNNETEMLVQKRAEAKLTWPGYWDISAAGHIDADETPLQAAVRETREELGLSINEDRLQLLFMRYADDTLENGIHENEFMWVYLYELPQITDQNIIIQEDEVDSIQWVSLDELEKLSYDEAGTQKLVPHVYFKDLIMVLHQITA